jgi:hypothetical protein
MGTAVLLVLGVIVFNSETVTEFRAHSNGNPKYVVSYVKDCETGLRSSGFANAPVGSVVLKQVNLDGSVGDTCDDS